MRVSLAKVGDGKAFAQSRSNAAFGRLAHCSVITPPLLVQNWLQRQGSNRDTREFQGNLKGLFREIKANPPLLNPDLRLPHPCRDCTVYDIIPTRFLSRANAQEGRNHVIERRH